MVALNVAQKIASSHIGQAIGMMSSLSLLSMVCLPAGLILEPMPIPAVALAGVVVTLWTNTLTFKQVSCYLAQLHHQKPVPALCFIRPALICDLNSTG
jgi:hypothetical protein